MILRKSRTNRVVLGHGVAVRDSSRGRPMPHFLEDGSILQKNFNQAVLKGQKVIAPSQSWTSKQQDFFNGERRFIFKVPDLLKAHRWINAINTAAKMAK